MGLLALTLQAPPRQPLADIVHLNQLDLRGTQVTAAAVTELRKQLPRT